jgi:VIT1/CCC1 family predicted Fe2+/Mn2+ transporter
VITSDKKIWVDTMMVEELGILLEEKSPIKAAVVTFISFFSIGMVPLSAYILAAFYPSLLPNAFTYAIVLTGLTIFMMGVLKSRITGLNWLRSGIETLAIGSAAAFVAYYIGFLLREFQFES